MVMFNLFTVYKGQVNVCGKGRDYDTRSMAEKISRKDKAESIN